MTSVPVCSNDGTLRSLAACSGLSRAPSSPWRRRSSTLEQQIAAGIPVPCGYLHRGPVSSPAGGGHWLIVVGITPTHVIVHDPLGEADLVNGTTLGGAARFCRYSRQNYRSAGLRLRPALDGGGRGQRLGGVGGEVISGLIFGPGQAGLPGPTDGFSAWAGAAGDRPHHRPERLRELQLLIRPVGGESGQQAVAVAVDAEHGGG
jgi:hypothetical protein